MMVCSSTMLSCWLMILMILIAEVQNVSAAALTVTWVLGLPCLLTSMYHTSCPLPLRLQSTLWVYLLLSPLLCLHTLPLLQMVRCRLEN